MAVVAVGFGLLLRGQRPAPEVAQTMEIATATYTPAPTPTPLPPTGTPGPRHLSAAVEVQVPEGFWLKGLEGNVVVGDVEVNGTYQTLFLDLASGEVLETYAKPLAAVSGRWAVRVESTELADGSSQRWLRVHDRQTEDEYTIEVDHPIYFDLSGDVLVWQEYGGDIFAQDLQTGQRWAIAEGPFAQRYPHISGSWVIYLDRGEHPREERTVDLRAYHLASGEDRLLGQVYHPATSSAGTYHAIDGSRVVWTTPPSADDTTFRVLSLDLEDPQAQPAVVMSGDFGPGSLRLFDEILVYHLGRGKVLYDLRRREELAVVEESRVVYEMVISGNLVVWGTTDGRLYTARIEQ